MDSITDDPRFSQIHTDPRFRPMPKSKRKVKIDKRFDSLFKSKHFKTRTDIDKRGRPVLDVSKRNKHVMQRFYELSSSSSDSENSESESENSSDTSENEITFEEDSKDICKDKKIVSKKSKSDKSCNKNEKIKKKDKHSVSGAGDLEVPTKNKKRKLSNDSTKFVQATIKSKKLIGKSVADNDDYSIGLDNGDGNKDKEDKYEMDDFKADSNDSDDDEEDDDDEESLPEYTVDHDLAETEIEHKWSELHADAMEVSESTHRLAVCNMDWDFVKAQDLFVLLKSFVPDDGRVKSVVIYPSEFGKKRMAEEALLGPKEMREMVDDRDSKGAEEEEGEGKMKRKRKKKEVIDHKQQKDHEKETKRYETEKLREYQLNRLRYFYAVVDCDSVGTADAIYNECDGKEYQLSSVQMDLRYIPDDMTFDDEPKDSFSQDQSLMDYTPSTFNSTALSQANVDVTWDETDFDRLSRRVVGLQRKELENMVEDNQYADMIAPAESDSEVENDSPDWLKDALAEESGEEDGVLTEERKIMLYRKVLIEKLTGEKENELGDVDQEIEWTPGLKSTAQEKLKKKKKGKEVKNDIVEGYLEKKRLKKKKKIEVKKKQATVDNDDDNKDDEDAAFSDNDMPSHVDDSLKELMESEGVLVSKKSKKGKKKSNEGEQEEEDSEAERERAELELLMMGDGDKHIAKPKMVEDKEGSGKMSKKKKKKLAKLAKEKKARDEKEFTLDMEKDDRFNALFTSHHFHIDPNAPQFKKTHNMDKLVDEQISRKKKSKTKQSNNDTYCKLSSASGTEQSASNSVSKQLVESLKKKMKNKNKK